MTHDFEGVLNLPKGIWKDRSFSDDEIQTIQAALKMAIDGGRRDIESVPKDGQFLGWVVNAYGHKHVVNVVAKGGSYWAVNFDPECLSHGPIADKLITKWQPLPQPPKESEK